MAGGFNFIAAKAWFIENFPANWQIVTQKTGGFNFIAVKAWFIENIPINWQIVTQMAGGFDFTEGRRNIYLLLDILLL